jgi:hypothetical protein
VQPFPRSRTHDDPEFQALCTLVDRRGYRTAIRSHFFGFSDCAHLVAAKNERTVLLFRTARYDEPAITGVRTLHNYISCAMEEKVFGSRKTW